MPYLKDHSRILTKKFIHINFLAIKMSFSIIAHTVLHLLLGEKKIQDITFFHTITKLSYSLKNEKNNKSFLRQFDLWLRSEEVCFFPQNYNCKYVYKKIQNRFR